MLLLLLSIILLLMVLMLLIFAKVTYVLHVTDGVLGVGKSFFFVSFTAILWRWRRYRLPGATPVRGLIDPSDIVVITGATTDRVSRTGRERDRNFAVNV